MKKNKNWLVYVTLAALILTLAAFLFPLGSGIVRTVTGAGKESIMGYDFIFGNKAMLGGLYATSPFIAAFSLLIIAAVFQIVAFIFYFPEGSHKFAGFMNAVGGLCILVAGIIFILAVPLAGSVLPAAKNVTYTLGYGFLIAGIAGAASGIASIVAGVIPFLGKKK
jgi:hypothetical protein